MRSTITNHGNGLYSVSIWKERVLLRRIEGLTSMADCRAAADRERKLAAGLLLLPGLDDLPTTTTVTQQSRLF